VTRRIEKVVIVGRDAAAWLVALGLQRAVGQTGVKVQVVELPSLLQPVDFYPALPSLAGLHALLGVPEAAMLKACRGVPTLGQRFVGWGGEGSSFVHAYDIQRPAIEQIDFLQYWVKARGQGLKIALEDFSLAAAAAKQGRLSDTPAGPDTLAGFQPGYHLDALRYVRFLRGGALAAGVEHRPATLDAIRREGDRITAIVLHDGTEIGADLFVDATGAEAALIGQMPGAEVTSWGEWLGCDRILAASAPVLRPLPAFGQVTALRNGWVGLYPLQDRTALIASYAADGTSDQDVLAEAAAAARVPVSGDVVVSSFEPGIRARPWVGNCVAVGAAAVGLEPLDAVQLQIVQIGLSNLVALWPVEADTMPEAPLYGAAMASHAANLRDFQIAHYRLNRRAGQPFWDRARDAGGPASLQAKLSLFGSCGQVPLYDDESFLAQNWSAVFVGHGLIPKSYNPAVDAVPPQEQMESFQKLLHVIAEEVRAMPTVETWLARRTG